MTYPSIVNYLKDDFKEALIEYCRSFRNYEFPKDTPNEKIFILDSDTGESYSDFDKIELKDDRLYMDQYEMKLILNEDRRNIKVCPIESDINLSVHYTHLIDSINNSTILYHAKHGSVLKYLSWNLKDDIPDWFLHDLIMNHRCYVKEIHPDKYVVIDNRNAIEYTIPRQDNLWFIIYKNELFLISEDEYPSINYYDCNILNRVEKMKGLDDFLEIVKEDYKTLEAFNEDLKKMKDIHEGQYNISKYDILKGDGLVFYFKDGPLKDNFHIRSNLLFRFITKIKGIEFPEEEMEKW